MRFTTVEKIFLTYGYSRKEVDHLVQAFNMDALWIYDIACSEGLDICLKETNSNRCCC
jgi:hypothetical protein